MSEPVVLSCEGGLVVVNKPTGWVAHAAHHSEQFDVQAWLKIQKGLPPRLAPLHRLDRDTSGLLLYGAPGRRKEDILAAFTERTVKKSYLALVYGRPHKKGIVRKPLADSGKSKAGREATTRFTTLRQLGGVTLLEVRPETGRKHQIRRHLQLIGHAVVGDTRYRQRPFKTVPAFPGRLWLHAHTLDLPDGTHLEAPLPPELAQHIEALEAILLKAQEPSE